ncbi:MAG: DUF3488 domain-containing protein, partial [Nitrospinaceae bacterium]|nr:DUF3488 domain-containing protein [Nitrospinaceae bacterium]NIR57364.1 DUF3488 domain-containing protein [Nitrospinaceae bacterium]NIS87816.1 DUF3488 domain-containing protein [Nitrospinaceae bacterium]NIT84686.1 DUF3488 domain-containing protein [Nitrospinaceae bacterium]NIU46865.1 DUF3488 domain-containing protein [Nitrospinaceae bacterium]
LSFPRTGLGFLSIQADHPISGFSETVTLGDVGKIKQNPAVVMRVEYTQNGKPYRPKSRIFWRGVVLDHYDGKTWSSTVPVGWGARNRPPVGVHVLQVPDPVNPVEQTVYVESFDTDILFTHGLPLVVKGRFNSLLMNQNFVLQTRGQRSGPRKITLISDIGRPNRSFPQKLPRPDPRVFPDRYLQLPPLGDRIHKLAQDITRHAATPVAKANHILT